MRRIEDFKTKIIELFSENLYRPLLPKALAELLEVEPEETEYFDRALEKLEEDGDMLYTGKGKCIPPEMMGLYVGIFQKNTKGFGFVIRKNSEERDIFIHKTKTLGAMNKDLVAARITGKVKNGERTEGEIVRIIKRNTDRMVCIFQKKRDFGFAVPMDRKIDDVFIKSEQSLGAQDGDRVIVEVIDWSTGTEKSVCGKVIEIIGHKGDKGLNVLSLLREQGFEEEFSDEVKEEIKEIPDSVKETDIAGRKDLRNEIIFTIDGEDTKDIDDAVSIEKLDNGNYRLGVHIADVSHYVREGTHLDLSAYERGTSIYPVDRVSPMLPPKLSNGICSLNPKVDRLAMSVVMDIDKNGSITGHDIFKSVIRSCEQMTYTNVYKIIEENDSELREKYSRLVPSIELMKELTLILRKKRFERGAIDFDMPEAKLILDSNDKPVKITKREITIANRMIEEMMLACNETVAEHFFWLETPFVYRVHEDPDDEKLEHFFQFARVMGYNFKNISNIHSKELQKLLEKVKGKKEERVISSVMLRSMQKARYTNSHSGHFGLAASYYCHFTSPIRRYPDLMIHRIISESLSGKMDEKRITHYDSILGEVTGHCSERERAADSVERESIKLKMAEYMINHIGEEFPCIISGAASFGMFVETDNLIEGLVPMESLYDDYYYFDDRQYALIGERTKKKFQIGDSITARVVKADTTARTIEFAIDLEYN